MRCRCARRMTPVRGTAATAALYRVILCASRHSRSDLVSLEPLNESVGHVRGPGERPGIREYGDCECQYSRPRPGDQARHRTPRRCWYFRHFPLRASGWGWRAGGLIPVGSRRGPSERRARAEVAGRDPGASRGRARQETAASIPKATANREDQRPHPLAQVPERDACNQDRHWDRREVVRGVPSSRRSCAGDNESLEPGGRQRPNLALRRDLKDAQNWPRR